MSVLRSIARKIIGVSAVSALVASGAMFALSPSAQAYDPDVWDRVAFCESTNRWHINTGNGYYGGLQFSKTTWLEFGGGDYAPYAHRASKAEQIAVARRVLAVQGPGAWPVCSERAGLTKSNGGADRDAQPGDGGGSSGGSESTPPASGGSGGSGGSGDTIEVKSGDTLWRLAIDHDVDGGWQALARANDLSAPYVIQVGQQLAVPGGSTGGSSSGSSAGGSSGGSSGGASDGGSSSSGERITVRAGDTLWRLAVRHKVSGGWQAIAEANDLDDPSFIRIGQVLVLP